MTQPIHTREQLEKFSISELRVECDRLSIPRRRSREDCIKDILAAQPQLQAVATLKVQEVQQDEQQPANLPQVNDTHFIGDFLLRCISIGGDYATVWDVAKDGSVLGEIKMDWNCFWTHTMSLDTFATPQEAVIDLYQSLQELEGNLDTQPDEFIAFETVADGIATANVNGVLVRIVSVTDGYKTNLTGNSVFADYDVAIKELLLAVVRVQELRSAERIERAQAIAVLEQCGDGFIVKNTTNGSHYIVQPSHPDPNKRCECGDCQHRGSKCKHQIAVENFLGQRLVAA
ncbi:MAG TPA: hypothetical protein VE944_28195 [Nostoc sp.]|uniref:hypothetical protein n=1 Tax=Nostoc sp. TaxID=1180 RepID=UPI002D450AFC|nr:hypothetical protein [Nostoc sp.]HYX18179.1 hypothetical protein [Nostoc sp.]